MNVYQIIGGGIFIAVFCIGFSARAIQVSRRDPWGGGKLLTFFLALVVIGFIGGMGIYSTIAAYKDTGNPLPRQFSPKPPEHWWK